MSSPNDPLTASPAGQAPHTPLTLPLTLLHSSTLPHTHLHPLTLPHTPRPHQGLILDASFLSWRDLDQLPHADELQQQQQHTAAGDAAQASSSSKDSHSPPSRKHPVWLALDEVVDPVSQEYVITQPWSWDV